MRSDLFVLFVCVGVASFCCGCRSGKAVSVARTAPPAAYEAYVRSMLWQLRGKPRKAVSELDRAVRSDPKSAHLRITRARNWLRLGRFERARLDLSSGRQIRGRFADVYLYRAWLSLFHRRLAFAEKLLVKAKRLSPGWKRVYRMLARVYRLGKDWKRERRAYLRLIRLDPDDLEARMALVSYARRQGRHREAARILAGLLKAHPWAVGARAALAYVWIDLGKPRRAEKILMEAVDLSDDDPEVALLLWRLRLLRGRVSEAEKLLRRLKANAAPRYVTFAAERYLELGRAAASEREARKALAMDPGYPGALMVLAEVNLLRGKPEASLGLLRKALLRKKALSTVVQKLLRVYLVSGKCAEGNEFLKKLAESHRQNLSVLAARAELQAICSIRGTAFAVMDRKARRAGLDGQALYIRAMTLEAAGRWKEALTAVDKLLRLNPDDVQALNFTGYTRTERGDAGKKTVGMLVDALRLAPLDPYVMDSLGWALFKSGDLAGGGRYLERAAKIMPAQPEILGHLAAQRAATGRCRQARALLLKAIEYKPRPRVLKRIQKRLRKLGSPVGPAARSATR